MIQYDLFSLLQFQMFRNKMAMNMYLDVGKYYSKYINKEAIPVTRLSLGLQRVSVQSRENENKNETTHVCKSFQTD